MSLNKDVLTLILEELQYNGKSLYSCLLVNRAWCKIIVPILWKNPWKKKLWKSHFRNLIISHFSIETKEKLRSQGINLLSTGVQQKPLFNYIGFCRYLDLCKLEEIISTIKFFEESKMSIIRNEIFKLFINGDTKITQLYIPKYFDDQLHFITGAEHCFLELKVLQCNTDINLGGLVKIIKSIKELKFNGMPTDIFNINIRTIYQNCPNLKYFKLSINNSNILEFENLLINCRSLNGLVINIGRNCEKLFEVLTRSSPTSLFKFKFYFNRVLELETLKLFFDNWKGRHPMLLQINNDGILFDDFDFENYRANGIVKTYKYYYYYDDDFESEDFEWSLHTYNAHQISHYWNLRNSARRN